MPEILRDEFGIAHARAESEADAFFAQGFACAEDRLWQMEHDRLRACGRWAEVVGPGRRSRATRSCVGWGSRAPRGATSPRSARRRARCSRRTRPA